MENINLHKLTVVYSIQLGAYWAAYCLIYAYANIYLLDIGFHETVIGIIIAVGNMFGVAIQPFVSGFVDKTKSKYLHKIIIMFSMITCLILYLCILNRHSKMIAAVLFILADMFLQCCMPLTNSICAYYQLKGLPLNFGPPRSIGSLVYAGVSAVIGSLIAKLGINVIYEGGILFMLILAVSTMFLPVLDTACDSRLKESGECKSEGTASMMDFMRRYPWYILALTAMFFCMTAHNMTNGYMIQIVRQLGGGSVQMGNALAICAVAEIPVMVISPWAIRRFGAKRLLLFSTIIYLLKMTGQLIAPSVIFLYAVMLLQAGSFAVYIPASVAFAIENLPEEDMVRGQSVVTISNVAGGISGYMIGGFLTEYFSITTTMFATVVSSAIGIMIMASCMKKVK